MPRYSTIRDFWTDDQPCEQVSPQTKCLDAKGRDVGPFAFLDTDTGMVGFKSSKNDPSHQIPWLEWKICLPPLKIELPTG